MSSFFFAKTLYAVAFLFVVCLFFGTVYADGAAKTVEKVELFKTGKTGNIIIPENGEISSKKEIDIRSFYSPFLLAADNVIVAIAGVSRNVDLEKNIDILTNYTVTTENGEWINKAFPIGGTAQNWNTQFALQEDNQKKVLKSLAAAARGDKIYILVVNQSTTSSDKVWEFLFVEGTVSKEGVQRTTKITWGKSQLSDSSIYKKFQGDVSDSNPQFLSALVTTDETVVFFVKVKPRKAGKNVFAITKSKDSDTVLEVLSIDDDDKSCKLNFLLWGDKVIMIPTSCNEGTGPKIEQFDFKDKKFDKSKESVGRVWDFLKDKKDITTATFNDTPVVLFTQEKGTNGNKKIHLWITDGNRSANVGSVFNKGDDGFHRSFVCTKNKLLSLHQKDCLKNENVYEATYSSTGTEQLIEILNAWNEGNKKVSDLCKKSDAVKISCSTDGLVGFLSGNTMNTDKEWIDEYQYAKATVTNGTKIDNGFQFNKPKAGAKWILKKKEEDQPYDFRNPGFTLVATVTIGSSTNSEKNSILGFGLADDATYVCLWCTKDGQWGVGGGDESTSKDATTKCGQGETYIIALVMNEENLSIYVDGKELTGFDDKIKQIKKDKAIAYFYFGANDAKQLLANTDMTIANVMLYNRPLEKEKEISELKAKKLNEDIRQNTGGNDNNLQRHDGGTTEPGESSDTPPTKENETKDVQPSSPSPTTEDSAARVGVVGVLCFMLFGVFTLLGRYVY